RGRAGICAGDWKSVATMMAAARVVFSLGVYLELERNVNSVSDASSSAATPVISGSAWPGGMSIVHPRRVPISVSFMESGFLFLRARAENNCADEIQYKG